MTFELRNRSGKLLAASGRWSAALAAQRLLGGAVYMAGLRISIFKRPKVGHSPS